MSNIDAPLDVAEFRAAVTAFKEGWATADALGMDGHRTEVGLLYAMRRLRSESTIDIHASASAEAIRDWAASMANIPVTPRPSVAVENERDPMDESDKSDRIDHEGDVWRWDARRGGWAWGSGFGTDFRGAGGRAFPTLAAAGEFFHWDDEGYALRFASEVE